MFDWLTRFKSPKAPPTAVAALSVKTAAEETSESKRLEGNAFLEREQLDLAAASYREAVRLDGHSVPARVNLAYVLMELGRPDEAETQLARAVALDSNNFDAHFMLARLARAKGAIDAAILHFDKVIALKTDFEPAYKELCLACVESGRIDRVEALLRRGLQALPRSADLNFLLANALHHMGQAEEAVASHKRALELKPDHVEAHLNLALVLRSLGRLEEAAAHLQRVAAFRVSDLDAQLQYGIALQSLGRHDASINAFGRAVVVNPASAVALSSLGSALAASGRSDEAIAQYKRAIAADKTHYFAYAGLGVQLNEQGRPREAIENLRQAVNLNPDAIEPHSSMLFLMSFVADPDQYVEAARRYGEKVIARAKPLPAVRASDGLTTLRVGLVSGDLRAHPVASFLESVLASLDQRSVEVFAYVTTKRDDEVTVRLRRHCSGWRSIVGMDDESAARCIRADGIHVLIDLAGHTAHNRLPVFAWKPAPVQVTWLGYLASSGLPSMDYVLADRVSLPEENHGHFVERVWYMPNSLYCFTAPLEAPRVSRLPALDAGHITFGSFQRMNKVSDETLAVWARVLLAVPSARLRLQSKQMADPRARAHAMERLGQSGIPTDRVDLAGPIADRAAYLSCHERVDIVLDTFPYCGMTTTCEALWMGVPTVTLAGRTLLSRQGASLLHCVGLDDWIAGNEEEYVALAVRHASDLGLLSKLRAGLRKSVQTSPLLDAPRFALDLEHALRGMWSRSDIAAPVKAASLDCHG